MKTPCPLCNAPMEAHHTIDRFHPPFDISRCPNCTLEKQNPLPENANDYYNADYYEGRAEYSYRDERTRLNFDRFVWEARLKNIGRFIPAPADFLDVGCAFGGFALEAQRAGYRARGMDVSKYAINAAQKTGLELIQGDLCDTLDHLPAASVDIITLVEVFEHLRDPLRAMENIRRLLRPGGLLVIQTANFCGRQARRAGKDYHYYLPGHLFYYSTVSLRCLFGRFGFGGAVFYRGVDFGVLPKLRKSRGDFTRLRDYFRWFRIVSYHYRSKIAFGDFALTSSMTAYAFKSKAMTK